MTPDRLEQLNDIPEETDLPPCECCGRQVDRAGETHCDRCIDEAEDESLEWAAQGEDSGPRCMWWGGSRRTPSV